MLSDAYAWHRAPSSALEFRHPMTDPIDPERNAVRAAADAGSDSDRDPVDASGIDDAAGPAARRRAPRPRCIPKARAAPAPDAFTSATYAPDPDKAAIPFTTRVQQWFDAREWQPFEFQREVWRAIADGSSGLLHATTGAGKTWAVWFGAMAAFGDHAPRANSPCRGPSACVRATPARRNGRAKAGACRAHSSPHPKASR